MYLSDRSVVHTVMGYSLHVEFDQGCLWKGATYIIYRSATNFIHVDVERDFPPVIVPDAEFSARIPLVCGNYTLLRMNTQFNSHIFDFYDLTIEPTCFLTQAWGDIKLLDTFVNIQEV